MLAYWHAGLGGGGASREPASRPACPVVRKVGWKGLTGWSNDGGGVRVKINNERFVSGYARYWSSSLINYLVRHKF